MDRVAGELEAVAYLGEEQDVCIQRADEVCVGLGPAAGKVPRRDPHLRMVSRTHETGLETEPGEVCSQTRGDPCEATRGPGHSSAFAVVGPGRPEVQS